MCGSGNSNDNNVYIYLGYYGAKLQVGDLTYSRTSDKKEMIKHIVLNYSYPEFLLKLLECIDNGDNE